MRFISALLVIFFLGSAIASLDADACQMKPSTGDDQSAQQNPCPSHLEHSPRKCTRQKSLPSPLFRKSEQVTQLPPITPDWQALLKRMQSIWNTNVDLFVATIEIPEEDEKGTIEKLGAGYSASVWSLPGGTEGNIVQKIETNCLAILHNTKCPHGCSVFSNEQPLLTEYIVSELVCKQDTSVCPVIFSISPQAPISRDVFSKLGIRMDARHKSDCIKKVNGQNPSPGIRKIEEEFVGPSVTILFGKALSPVTRAILASEILIKSIDLLEKLHARGFIHGDIHTGNIALRKPNEDSDDLVVPELTLIDFGQAKFYPLEIGTPECVGEDAYASMAQHLLSKFQLELFRTSRRDDLYRAFEVFMNLITEDGYLHLMGRFGMYAQLVKSNFDAINPFKHSNDALGDFKLEGSPPMVYNGIESLRPALSLNDFDEVSRLWNFVYRYVASEIEIDQTPNYALIRDTMFLTLDILKKYSTRPAVGMMPVRRVETPLPTDVEGDP
jgi:hypothetical protein